MDLSLRPSQANCGAQMARAPQLPAASQQRLENSSVVSGTRNIVWAWFGSPTIRYPHRSLGAFSHAASVHVLMRTATGALEQVDYILPNDRVFEDLLPRLVDLDGDGQDELILIESSNSKGAALVVLGVQRDAPSGLADKADNKNYRIQELARSPSAGGYFRWLNPVGATDFNGDGKLDLAAIITPHIGGVLTLYQYQPPNLVVFASLTDVSNHRMGQVEQRLAVIVPAAGQQTRPTIIVPDMGLKALYALRWTVKGGWQEIDKVKALPATVSLLLPNKAGACAQLSDGSWWLVNLMQ
jgi:hypothetical protein